MLYTRRGDKGRTSIFGCRKFSKNSPKIEALGALDELNSLLGLCKIKTKNVRHSVFNILEEVQNDLFVLQAEIAGSGEKLKIGKTKEIEKIIDKIEKELPKQKSFAISGGTELSALLDFSRAIARRAERRAVALKGKDKLSFESLKYLNRLSSLLFALARQCNKKSGIKERSPRY